MNKKLLYLLLIILASCGKGEKTSPDVYFAGEIVNPTSSYVVLYKGDNIIDSTKLDAENRFSFRFDSIDDGLYHFNHAPELQYVYLKKGDSLTIRLNTVAFDESLIFSGVGEEINNFLLDLFLANEEERPAIYSTFRLEPDVFIEKLDSLADQKLSLLNALTVEGNLTDKEVKIAKASILYEYDSFKEKYPFVHRKYTQDKKIKELPASFYDYRKNLDFNDNDLTYLRPYYNFMNNHFGNVTYMSCASDCDLENKKVKNHFHFNRHKLHLIDSIVIDKELKDNLLRKVAFDYLLKAHDSEENNEIFIEQFHELSNNNRHNEEIDELYEGIRNIQPKKTIPEVYVNNSEGESVSLRDISKGKKTVFYFWSGEDKRHFKEVNKRIASLDNKKSKYQFIGINIRTEETSWKGIVQTAKLDPDTQFRSENFEELTKALIIYPINKCIIAENGKIINAFSNIFSNSLEKQVSGYNHNQIAKN
ncbi:redoxin domain-containing protein [Aurantibacter crassamenti]|uniref:redoxin domain-containing protein n=1 Tax=Aurantibacter crassamenti TaxID=1837375 RepID=UPI00193A5FE9|nr:redoxin domain-containing protein [Aurantibacter crassamenti]MBM1107445.1 redoxin domain-containing protein [Aurantibacter crassamenti]